MALADLATTADLDDRGITYADVPNEVATLLREASTMVRDAAGVPILQTTSTVTLAGFRQDHWLTLPGPPIRSAAAVTIDGTSVTDWRLADGRLWRACGWSTDDGPAEVEVTMTHGLAEVPADIVGLVCSMVAAGIKAVRADDEGTGLAARDPSLQAFRLDDYSETYATGADAAATSPTVMALPQRTRDDLRRRFGGGIAAVTSR
jgi:hypothetical protein